MSGMPGPLVHECQPEPAPVAAIDRRDVHDAAAAVVDGVASELARRRDELRLVDQAEAQRDRPIPHELARAPRPARCGAGTSSRRT